MSKQWNSVLDLVIYQKNVSLPFYFVNLSQNWNISHYKSTKIYIFITHMYNIILYNFWIFRVALFPNCLKNTNYIFKTSKWVSIRVVCIVLFWNLRNDVILFNKNVLVLTICRMLRIQITYGILVCEIQSNNGKGWETNQSIIVLYVLLSNRIYMEMAKEVQGRNIEPQNFLRESEAEVNS